MVKFSCFNAQMLFHKAKKPGQLPAPEVIDNMSQVGSHIQAQKDLPDPKNSNPLFLKEEGAQSNTTTKHVRIASIVEPGLKSEEMNIELNGENNLKIHQSGHLKKSKSLGSKLYQEGRIYDDNDIEGETDQGFSCDDSHDLNSSVVLDGSKDPEVSQPNHRGDFPSVCFQVSSDLVNNESIFSIGDAQFSEKDTQENSDTLVSGEHGDSCDRTPRTPRAIVQSCSMPTINACIPNTEGNSPLRYIAPRSRSFEDLNIQDIRHKDISVQEAETQVIREQERDDSICITEKNNSESPVHSGYDSYSCLNLAKDSTIRVMGELNMVNYLEVESPVLMRDELPSKDFKIKRIEEWVTELQHCSPEEEESELPHFDDQLSRGSGANGLTVAKVDVNVGPGMEAAKRYISSLSAVATTAQLANHGLVAIPFLSIFVSLRTLNLSGNAIARITASALPRGLHVLNLSKNNISTIEGLRELSRLRVLDLSYNRIFRIGHGLASCSSLKELYLAGNKISEVEGLHRLLKLNVLDLRFNKISTAKCLGQLAANYSSLHTISLEGNPAQKNVGDEQLKKYLQGLLPYLTSFNKQLPNKVSTSKDAADRSARLGISGHQFDRGLRSDHKAARKSGHGLSSHRPSSSSTHGRKSQAAVDSPKQHRGRHGRLPPTGTRATTQYFDFRSKLLNSKADISRSRSEGTLGVL